VLAGPAGVEVDTYDERFTTVTAEQGLRDAKVGRSKRRAKIDAAAATVILQSWLEANR
jgi:putative Holliday junction resolvase